MYYRGGLSLVVETNHLDYLDYFIVEEELGQVKARHIYIHAYYSEKEVSLGVTHFLKNDF